MSDTDDDEAAAASEQSDNDQAAWDLAQERNEKIEPALTESRLADIAHNTIALANAALPDGDPRKITREWINELRYAAGVVKPIVYFEADPKPTENDQELMETSTTLNSIAAALESYLPPDSTNPAP